MGYPFMAVGTIYLWGVLRTPAYFAADPWQLLIAAALVGIGILIWLPREVTTTFDLRAQEVRQVARRWKRVRHRVIAFDDIASIGFYQPDATEPAKFPVVRLKRTEQIQIVSSGDVLEEKAMNFIAAVTGLPRIDTVYRG